eukprot:scaffold651511_cov46-Prasinocladus_malaysianus.AAC.1
MSKAPERSTALPSVFGCLSVRKSTVRSSMEVEGTYVAPICCVIPPASPSWTLVRRTLSRIL